MPRRLLLSALTALALLAWLAAQPDAVGAAPPAPVRLPVEVLAGRGEAVVEVTLDVADATGIDRLYLQVHRPSYRDAAVNPARGPKASVRLNGGPWVGLTDANADVFDHETAYGGLAGAYRTVRMTIPVARLGPVAAGANTVAFRFHGTDGFTVGYRVLALNLLRADSREAVPASAFARDDPGQWAPPRPADMDEGARLWATAPIVDGPDGAPIQATCASCHARDGRDLWYFAYSNASIEARSRFHGLSEREAEQIASYVRSLQDRDATTAGAPPGRPWNPPYQPGLGLDARPARDWAAGAGLEAVLEHDADALTAVVARHASGRPAATLAEAVDTQATLNLRETPIPLQLPDWNDWLPEVHPVDLWGAAFTAHRAATDYDDARARFATDRAGAIAEAAASHPSTTSAWPLSRMHEGARRFWRYDGAIDFETETTAQIETKHRSLFHWTSVKSWELAQAHALEALGPEVYGAYGEPRGRIGVTRSLFELAPHLATHKRDVRFRHQSDLAGVTASTAWYHLQLIVANGHGVETGATSPVDWTYHPNHIADLARVGGPEHPVRYLLSTAKMAQLMRLDGTSGDADRRVDGAFEGVAWRQLHPARLAIGLPGRQALAPRTADVLDAYLASFLGWVETVPAEAWPRRPDADGDGAVCDTPAPARAFLQAADWDGDRYTGSDAAHCEDGWGTARQPTSRSVHEMRHAQNWYWMVPRWRALGVPEPTLARMVDWGESVWPRGAWGALRPAGGAARVALAAGANTVTLPVSLDGAALAAWFERYPALVLVKDTRGRAYAPSYGVRDLALWDAREAYHVYTSAALEVEAAGPARPADAPVVLAAGWNVLPYYPREARPWREALAPIVDAVDYLDDGAGGIFDVRAGRDEAGVLRPGRGYRIHLRRAASFTYAPDS